MAQETVTVRRLSSGTVESSRDWAAVYELCCRTGNNGQPVAAERWDFFGRLWVEPYKTIFPQWTYVAETKNVIVGYLTGCPDTNGFTRVKLSKFSVPLLADVIRGRYAGNRDVWRFAKQILRLEKTPERIFPRALVVKLWQNYPAHLHMNVEADWRGSGIGTKLAEQFFTDLGAAGIPGVHLYCGAAPLKFYEKQGFKNLAEVVFRGVPVYALGQRFHD
jgi:GNAT superfamily N-acetyltransferase